MDVDQKTVFRTFLATVGRQSTGHARCRKVALAAAFSNCRTSAPRINAIREEKTIPPACSFFFRKRSFFANPDVVRLRKNKWHSAKKEKKKFSWGIIKWKKIFASNLLPILKSTATFSSFFLLPYLFVDKRFFHVVVEKPTIQCSVFLLLANGDVRQKGENDNNKNKKERQNKRHHQVPLRHYTVPFAGLVR